MSPKRSCAHRPTWDTGVSPAKPASRNKRAPGRLGNTEAGWVAGLERTQETMPEGMVEHAGTRLGVRLSSVLVALRRQLKELYGDRLVKVLLCGSRVRGDAVAESDVDLPVVLEGPVRPSEQIPRAGAIVSAVCLAFDEVIQCLFMEERRFRMAGKRPAPQENTLRAEPVTVGWMRARKALRKPGGRRPPTRPRLGSPPRPLDRQEPQREND